MDGFPSPFLATLWIHPSFVVRDPVSLRVLIDRPMYALDRSSRRYVGVWNRTTSSSLPHNDGFEKEISLDGTHHFYRPTKSRNHDAMATTASTRAMALHTESHGRG